MRPTIGITSGMTMPVWRPDGSYWMAYAAAVERAGGEPVHLDRHTIGRERQTIKSLQGILFAGGNDVDLAFYPNPPPLHGEDPDEVMRRHEMTPEPLRDEYEIPLVQEAVERDLPLLGICRGCQVLNVALGGRLILDIRIETGTPLEHRATPEPERASRFHALEIEQDSLLAQALDPLVIRTCNTRHHQAVRIDESLPVRVTARSPEDGIVEAIELPGRRWCIGVQWHPEHPRDDEVREMHQPLFNAFLRAASG